MERLETVVGGLILHRNKEDWHDLEVTHEIDKLLQDAAASMPAQWWLSPDTVPLAGSDADAFRETMRMMNQFAHYHLLARLHLPYLFQPSADPKYDNSKITAANASREILSRFVSFQGSQMKPAYCRGVDFLAFVASTTLCLAHIDARRQSGIGIGKCGTVLHFLAHQRLPDRGLMERTLQIMETRAQFDKDAIACKIAGKLRPLLAIDEAVARRGCYGVSLATEHDEQVVMCDGNENEGGGTLCIDIPHFGTIKIEHDGLVSYGDMARTPGEEGTCPDSAPEVSRSRMELRAIPNRAAQESWREESPFKAYPSGCQIGDQCSHAGWQAVQSHLELQRPIEKSQAATSYGDLFSLNDAPLEPVDLLSPGILAADVADCALQGVDVALFDSLFDGLGT